ncbi:hypothetical protein DSCW_04060 [Desulfosarcina widdelii]|uniref:Uncharacterized protein n=1 Tax=Desulfosarcina widdelii TaxID=947919 RepID=A0A5K7YY86_9BACT|nr:hypothetical protein DSCW_04060 [Desulfosarcina widdelii]
MGYKNMDNTLCSADLALDSSLKHNRNLKLLVKCLVSQPVFNHIEATASNVRKILYVIQRRKLEKAYPLSPAERTNFPVVF